MNLKNILLTLAAASSALALTSQQVIGEMGLGWNLGNTLEAFGDWINGSTVNQFETAWGNPAATEQLIGAIKDNGFNSIRIPVAWSNLMSSDYTINSNLLKRVKEVVSWVTNKNMYAIINIHYDGGWFEQFGTSQSTQANQKFNKIWTQVSSYFKDFDEHLIFESLNEEGCWNDVWNRWSNAGDKNKAYGTLNNLNQQFVDIVRNSGGNNKNRHLLLAGYCTDIDLTVDSAFKIPSDSSNRLMVSVHYYTPSTFTILEKDEDWGKFAGSWGTDAEVKALIADFDKLKKRFVDNGIPVIIGEYGTVLTNKNKDSVHKYLFTCAQYATSLGMCPMLWDNGDHFDRKGLKFKDSEIGDFYKHHGPLVTTISSNSGSNNNNNNASSSSCWSEPEYPCCKESCTVYYVDDHQWGIENGEWCGIPDSCGNVSNGVNGESCLSAADYPCCEQCNIVSEEEGDFWGVENNEWCSIKFKCYN
ncbi:cellulase-domain-containing protein [Piromyces finnis]|uniref:Cellulase-domain-containing protein n=1 Tax=Piromyces finnis TaxID=1754191 RepID=A0A1Y1V0W8_9FUNG|nr:cellulase-domain-containing protein [Piromyces finnis]|eukprot:ORX43621.1 cellulase-domain-containing protein [Piromyces finnis]